MRPLFLITLSFLYIVLHTNAAQAQLPAPAPVPDRNSSHQSTPPEQAKPEQSTPAVAPTADASTAAPVHSYAVSVSVGGVAIDGLSDQEALQKLQTELAPLLQRKVSLNDGNQV